MRLRWTIAWTILWNKITKKCNYVMHNSFFIYNSVWIRIELKVSIIVWENIHIFPRFFPRYAWLTTTSSSRPLWKRGRERDDILFMAHTRETASTIFRVSFNTMMQHLSLPMHNFEWISIQRWASKQRRLVLLPYPQ